MFKTLTIALASAAVIGMQAMAVTVNYESGEAFSTYANNKLINTEETTLRATDGTTMILDAKATFIGTLSIQGTVTLSIPEYCGGYTSKGHTESDSSLLDTNSLTFGHGAHLIIDLSDATLDVIMTSYDNYDGNQFGAQALLLGGRAGDYITLSDATVARFAQRGIEIISTDDPYEAIADGKGALVTGPTTAVYFGKQGTPIAAPEPATATLSLLALAGLCARRKRH